jgi:hypothetical protein
MAYSTESIESRIAWCQGQKTRARAAHEFEEWHAEEEGLRDAFCNRDHTDQYRNYPSDVFKRYVMGRQDGLALIALQRLDNIAHSPAFG